MPEDNLPVFPWPLTVVFIVVLFVVGVGALAAAIVSALWPEVLPSRERPVERIVVRPRPRPWVADVIDITDDHITVATPAGPAVFYDWELE